MGTSLMRWCGEGNSGGALPPCWKEEAVVTIAANAARRSWKRAMVRPQERSRRVADFAWLPKPDSYALKQNVLMD